MTQKATDNPLDLAHEIVDTLEQKKGDNILLLDLRGVCSFSDYFVICSGASERTLRALSEEVQKRLKGAQARQAMSVEGEPEAGWILLDYGDVIVHLFSPYVRAYYKLEELWHEGRVLLSLQ